tara:strand:- start:216 stop:491 length:276 start_codon:yes stop_codon:yes gene_type:complete
MDYQTKKRNDWTCYCNRRMKNNEDPLFKHLPNLLKIKNKLNHRKYPNPHKIIDFNFKSGGKVAKMDKEKKRPTAGKIKMKTYGKMDTWTSL